MKKNDLSRTERFSLRRLFCIGLGLVLVQGSMSAAPLAVYSMPYTFTTIAPEMPPGKTNAVNHPRPYSHSRGLAVDAAGNIYFADTFNHTISRLTRGGVITILAGQPGISGSADGTGAAARFYYPQSLALDRAGNIYVADGGNDMIRRVTPSGVVTTLAGQACQPGDEDGKGNQARFNYPSGVAVDGAGDIYVADFYNCTIRKVTPDGVVTTLAGLAENTGSRDGRGSQARFNFPISVAAAGAGKIFVADFNNNAIRQVTPDGMVTTLAGRPAYKAGSADGSGPAAQFYHPYSLAVDGAENIYVADTANHTIRCITPGGTVVTLAGQAGQAGNIDGTGDRARFDHPAGIAVDGRGHLYVGELGAGMIREGFPAPASAVSMPPVPGLSLK